MKADALQIDFRGQRPLGECQPANAAQGNIVIGLQRGASLEYEFVPSREAMRNARTLALDRGCACLDQLVDDQQRGCRNGDRIIRSHRRAQHVQHRLVIQHGFFIGKRPGAGLYAIPGDPERTLHAFIGLVL
jgi:hypothetical protein